MAKAYRAGHNHRAEHGSVKPSDPKPVTHGFWSHTARWFSSLGGDVPLGYEDEDGFHFGEGKGRKKPSDEGFNQSSLSPT